jgi:hypothetical protein
MARLRFACICVCQRLGFRVSGKGSKILTRAAANTIAFISSVACTSSCGRRRCKISARGLSVARLCCACIGVCQRLGINQREKASRPVQLVMPSPEYPVLHAHVRVVDGAARSLHVAWAWQGCAVHALVSFTIVSQLKQMPPVKPVQLLMPSPEYPVLHAHVRVVDGGARSVHVA